MVKASKRKLDLAAKLSMIDDTHVYEDHYVEFEERGKYGQTYISDPPHSLTVSIPWVFEDAPDDVVTEVLDFAFNRAQTRQKRLYGPKACEYLSDPATLRKLRLSVTRMHEFHSRICPRGNAANRSFHTCEKLLNDYPEVMKAVTVKWRAPGIESKKIVSSDYMARISVFDPILLREEVRKPLRDYVMFREMCAQCAFSVERNAVQKWKFKLLIRRFPGWEHMEEMCKELRWCFLVKI